MDNVYNFKLMSMYDDKNEYAMTFDWSLDHSTFSIGNNPMPITHRNNTWAYYTVEIENFIKDGVDNIKMSSVSFYDNSIYQIGPPMTFESKLDLKNINFSIGNTKENILDEFKGEIFDLKFYNGIIHLRDGKYNSGF